MSDGFANQNNRFELILAMSIFFVFFFIYHDLRRDINWLACRSPGHQAKLLNGIHVQKYKKVWGKKRVLTFIGYL